MKPPGALEDNETAVVLALLSAPLANLFYLQALAWMTGLSLEEIKAAVLSLHEKGLVTYTDRVLPHLVRRFDVVTGIPGVSFEERPKLEVIRGSS